MRAINQAPDFWDKGKKKTRERHTLSCRSYFHFFLLPFIAVIHTANANANLPHNLNTRAAIGMDEYARPQTQWGPYGKMKVPPHWWLEYIKCKEQRCVDMLDILHASAARDAESHDSNFGEFRFSCSLLACFLFIILMLLQRPTSGTFRKTSAEKNTEQVEAESLDALLLVVMCFCLTLVVHC